MWSNEHITDIFSFGEERGIPLRSLAAFALALLLPVQLLASEILISSGDTLREARVLRREGSFLVIDHAVGIARVPQHQLPQDLQEQYFPRDDSLIPATPIRTALASNTRRFSAMTPDEQSDIVDDLSSRYILLPDLGLVEMLSPRGQPSLDATKRGYRYINDIISQTIRDDEYFISSNTAKLRVPGNKTLVDGSRVQGLVKDDGVYDYTTVQGASRRVRAYEMITGGKPHMADFVNEMRAGKAFSCLIKEDAPCTTCSGRGVQTIQERVASGYSACTHCGGHGRIIHRTETRRNPSTTVRGGGAMAAQHDRQYVRCSGCQGAGRVQQLTHRPASQQCGTCKGKRTMVENKVVDIIW